jgi:hypothetical protein
MERVAQDYHPRRAPCRSGARRNSEKRYNRFIVAPEPVGH